MLRDNWDIGHISIAVDDLEGAMSFYARAFGMTWSPIIDVDSSIMATPLYGELGDFGLRVVWSTNGAAFPGQPVPFAPLELTHVPPDSPARRIWGVEPGRHQLNHIHYWVEDLELESAHLIENGFALEMTMPPADRARCYAYHVAPNGMRLELMRKSDKPAFARWFETGELELDW